MNIWMTDPKSQDPNKSVTLTMFVIGFIVALTKLILSGITIGSVVFQPFSGVDFAAVSAGLGSIYALRRSQGPSKDE